MKLIDLTGQQFGHLLVLKRDFETQRAKHCDKPYWQCQCDCGNIVSVLGRSLREGDTISCGCQAKIRAFNLNFQNLAGQHFGELTVLRYLGHSLWECQCSCGVITQVLTSHLKSGHTLSCGHLASSGEYYIGKLLTEQHIHFQKQYTAPDLLNSAGHKLKVDFALLNKNNDVKYFLEYNGRQHYDQNDPWYKSEVEEGQQLKKQYAMKHNITFLIIKYTDDIREFIFNKVDFSEVAE